MLYTNNTRTADLPVHVLEFSRRQLKWVESVDRFIQCTSDCSNSFCDWWVAAAAVETFLMASPLHRHTRSGSSASLSNMKKPQNAKAAAQRLAQVMAHQPADDNEEEDDDPYDLAPALPSSGIGLAGGRQNRNRSPRVRYICHFIIAFWLNFIYSFS